MSSPTIAQSPTFVVGGAEMPDRWLDRLVSLRIERAFGLVGRATIRFSDEGYGLSATNLFALGSEVKFAVQDGSTNQALMTGDVTGVSLEQSSSDHPELVVVVDDKAHMLVRGNQVRTFTQVTYTDVIKKICTESGLRPKLSMGAAGSMTFPFLMQTGTTIDFLTRIAERTNCVWWVDDKTLNVVALSGLRTPVRLVLTEDLDSFSVRASGLRPDAVTVNDWDPRQKQEVTQKEATAPTAASDFVAAYTKPGSKLGARATSAIADRQVGTSEEAQLVAKSMFDEMVASSVVARGNGRANAKINLGAVAQVQNAGPASGSYLISEVEHSYGRNGFHTRFTAGTNRPAGLVDTLGTGPSETGFVNSGLVVGVVTNMKDPEGLGRLRVKYVGMSGTAESSWARVLTVGGGKARGVMFLPEVDDEVLVGFEGGDTRRPVVLGGLFSSKSQPPWKPGDSENNVQTRRITSRLGHAIEMGDGSEPGKQHLLLTLAGGHRLRLGADRFDVEVAQGKPVLIKSGQAKFEIDASGNVTIEGQNVTIKATGALKAEGLQVDIKAKAAGNIEATMLSLKGSATTTVESSGSTSIKGAMVAIN
ncbi:MAG: Rhs element Vgr protein [Pseudonocardiales bacterium]|nr:Rhs element Vgr protein [Pseudonocardiales bacterium]